uniref:Fatty acid-binding protein, muscle n=1 Tax=Cacopsylla melanoneura TaxID=428564 RepID=A0A8D8TI03_9HEMI
MVVDFLNKKFKLASSDKFDEYMKATGVGLITRKVGANVSPVMELEKDEATGEYTLHSNSTFKNHAIKFKLGEEFDEDTPDGRKVKSVITVDGNTMHHVQKGDKETIIERVFSADEVKMTLKVDDIVCTRIYKPL